ncbi:hypothetical protein PHLGIDRAFT_119454 [Phlebiopsis gigantea 11061_1 CR5-6]|uniref:F-box domain-containing protein n=1 Tax=Phlebiopsis gigantea (strain 11061_1 CR5-6) TaxID=745531 RepID=A0A0C3PIR3_PHLG1|nr:hypothetical protein PHLGIDRAFT_119454 [Phlebiopsis gigantea 11061_1 CR5-6]
MNFLTFYRRLRSAQTPSPAARHALAIDEVFMIILEYLYDDGRGRRSLASLAQTATFFTGPALAVLWKHLPNSRPLISVLLSRSEEFDERLGDNTYYDAEVHPSWYLLLDEPYSRVGVPQDASHREMCKISSRMSGHISHRVAWYFNHVKSLRWDNSIHNPVLSRLLMATRSDGVQGLLPNLVSLVWTNHRHGLINNPLILAQSRKIEKVEVSYQAHCVTIADVAEHIDRLIDMVAHLPPNVRTLKISMPGFWKTAIGRNHLHEAHARQQLDMLYKCLNGFLSQPGSSLLDLHLSTGSFYMAPTLLNVVDPPFLAQLNLTSLLLEIFGNPPADEPLSFPHLRSLCLTFNLPNETCAKWARQLSCPMLEHLTLSFNRTGSAAFHALTATHQSGVAAEFCNNPYLVFTEGVCRSDYFHTITSFALEYDHPPLLTMHDFHVFRAIPFEHWQQIVLQTERNIRRAQKNVLGAVLAGRPFPRVLTLSIALSNAIIPCQVTELVSQLDSFGRLQTLSVVHLPAHPDEDTRIGEFSSLSTLVDMTQMVENLPALRSLTMGVIDKRLCTEGYYDAWEIKHSSSRRMRPCLHLRHWNVLNSELQSKRNRKLEYATLKSSEVRIVCENLRLAFPRLETVECSEDNKQKGSWEAIGKYLKEHRELDRPRISGPSRLFNLL